MQLSQCDMGMGKCMFAAQVPRNILSWHVFQSPYTLLPFYWLVLYAVVVTYWLWLYFKGHNNSVLQNVRVAAEFEIFSLHGLVCLYHCLLIGPRLYRRFTGSKAGSAQKSDPKQTLSLLTFVQQSDTEPDSKIDLNVIHYLHNRFIMINTYYLFTFCYIK